MILSDVVAGGAGSTRAHYGQSSPLSDEARMWVSVQRRGRRGSSAADSDGADEPAYLRCYFLTPPTQLKTQTTLAVSKQSKEFDSVIVLPRFCIVFPLAIVPDGLHLLVDDGLFARASVVGPL